MQQSFRLFKELFASLDLLFNQGCAITGASLVVKVLVAILAHLIGNLLLQLLFLNGSITLPSASILLFSRYALQLTLFAICLFTLQLFLPLLLLEYEQTLTDLV